MSTQITWEELDSEELRKREDEIIGHGDQDDLNDLRSWLFRESVRLTARENAIDEKVERFEIERKQFREEMISLNHQLEHDRRQFRLDSELFEKRLGILKSGFDKLAEDKKRLEQDRIKFEAEKEMAARARLETGAFLFRGVNDQGALHKRYKDLIKIFHPDNAGGDHEIIQIINDEYAELTMEYGA